MVICDDFVGQYVGYIVLKIKEMFKCVQGGVLFIDEVYYFYKLDNECDYGVEVIEIFLQEMESWCSDVVVIFVGYRDWMEIFYSFNLGLLFRVVYYFDFFDYSDDELMVIVGLFFEVQYYQFSVKVEIVFFEYVLCWCQLFFFVNVCLVCNVLDWVCLCQVNWLFLWMGEVFIKQDFIIFEEGDIWVSCVFKGEVEGYYFVQYGF